MRGIPCFSAGRHRGRILKGALIRARSGVPSGRPRFAGPLAPSLRRRWCGVRAPPGIRSRRLRARGPGEAGPVAADTEEAQKDPRRCDPPGASGRSPCRAAATTSLQGKSSSSRFSSKFSRSSIGHPSESNPSIRPLRPFWGPFPALDGAGEGRSRAASSSAS